MERRRALLTAAASTVALGVTVVAGVSIGGYSLLGFGGGPTKTATRLESRGVEVVTKYRDVYDKRVVDTPDVNAGARTVVRPARLVAAAPGRVPTAIVTHHSAPARTTSPTTPSQAVQPPETSTTAPPTTPISWRHEESDDWPAGVPIPPSPANCQQPHLEAAGWLCENDD